MDKKSIISFFDKVAPGWDADMIKDQWKVDKILECAGVAEGCIVLDVACGTGVLIPDYLERKVKQVIGVDISPEMIRIATEKYKEYPQVQFVCADAEEVRMEEFFDCIMIYNAFPHFCQPEKLIKHLSGLLKTGGTLTVAHGMGKAQLDQLHSGSAKHVSNGLISIEEMEALMLPYVTVEQALSTEEMYLVTGRK